MKKGISLIVLVITIIVMIIIAGAIILSLNSSNINGRANRATFTSDRANLQAEYAVKYAEKMTAEEPTPTVAIEELRTPTKYNTYGAWKINDETGSVEFKLIADEGENFAKFLGFTAEDGSTAEAALRAEYNWIK